MTPLDLVEARLAATSGHVKRKGDNLIARCPSHEDRTPSLSVTAGTKGRDVVLHCHAGCTPDAVMAALGIAWTDFGPSEPQAADAVYVYSDVHGVPLYRVHRSPGKRFWQERLTTHGEWVKGLDGVPRVLYHLPEVLRAVSDARTIWVAEGEKDVDRLRAEGVVATCNSGGAGKFTADHADVLAGANVVIVADRDTAGYTHAALVASLLTERHATVRVVRSAHGKDAHDHLAAGAPITSFVTIDPARDEPTAEPEPWPELIPLGNATGDLPAFPVEALPAWCRQMVIEIADELQTPVDLPASLVLVALSVTCSGRRKVHVRSTWYEPLNLYIVVALPPSAGKSPAFRLLMRPITTWEAEQVMAVGPQADHVAQKRRIIEKAMKKAEDKGDTSEAMRCLDDLAATPEVIVPRLKADDATPEALVGLMARHNGTMALLSTEGGPFEAMAGRYSERANLDVYLKAWSGDAITVDRVGRGESAVPNPCLTIGLTVQPAVIQQLAENPGFTGRGLTARFMFAIPNSNVGWRNLVDVPDYDPVALQEYERRLLALLNREHADTAPPSIAMTDEARSMFLGWRQGLEQRRRPQGDLAPLAEWSTKLESTVVRVAGLLALADDCTTVDAEVMARAISIGWYWLDHAKIVHDLWGADETLAKARKVVEWLSGRGLTEFSVRDLYNALRLSFPTAEDTRPALSLLVERGWIRPMFEGPLLLGRRGQPSPMFAVRPSDLWISGGHACHAFHAPKDEKSNNSLSISLDTGKRNLTHDSHDSHDSHDPSGPTGPPPLDPVMF